VGGSDFWGSAVISAEQPADVRTEYGGMNKCSSSGRCYQKKPLPRAASPIRAAQLLDPLA